MPIGHHRDNDVLIIQPEGRINSADAAIFRHELNAAVDADDRAVVMDLEALTYISSSGLRVMLELAQTLNDRGARFALCSLSGSVQDVFRISGLGQVFTVSATRDEAMKKVAR